MDEFHNSARLMIELGIGILMALRLCGSNRQVRLEQEVTAAQFRPSNSGRIHVRRRALR